VCGAITIEDGGNFTSVTAIRGQGALRPIGHSSDNITCGPLTFGKKEIYTAGDDLNYYSTDGGGLNFEENTDNTWKLWR
jgi:hypothetical protein